jgi:putative glutamine amidotransferase
MSTLVVPEEVLPSGTPPEDPRAHIGVVAPLNFPDMTEEMAVLVRELISTTLATLWDLGATFDLLDPSTDLSGAQLPQGCEGLLLLGGGDIDPSCYTGGPKEMPGSYGINIRTDDQSLTLIAEAETGQLPILGICRGHQLINVHRGGTIIADIHDPGHIHHGAPGAPMFVTETIDLLPASLIQSILGEEPVRAWAAHHQAVDRLGDGLTITARAADGNVEAIEDPERWILGVQWHPERVVASASDRRKLFAALIDECASRKARGAAPRISAERG